MTTQAEAICIEPIQLGDIAIFEEPEYKDIENLQQIMERYGNSKNAVISILLDIQAANNFIPKYALLYVSERLEIPLSRLYSITTFYKAFSLKPRGKHIITVCLGTACHVRGGARMGDTISKELKIDYGETTEDMEFTLEAVNCLGACALGPVIMINDKYHGNMNPGKIAPLINQLQTNG